MLLIVLGRETARTILMKDPPGFVIDHTHPGEYRVPLSLPTFMANVARQGNGGREGGCYRPEHRQEFYGTRWGGGGVRTGPFFHRTGKGSCKM